MQFGCQAERHGRTGATHVHGEYGDRRNQTQSRAPLDIYCTNVFFY